MDKPYLTPGVYIEEKDAFPSSVVSVETAIPAFIGYTEKASRNKKNLTNIPTRITSLEEFLLFFGAAPKTTYDIGVNQLNYKLQAKVRHFLLFNSIRLFFANGGSTCYIVSIGDYDQTIELDDFSGEKIVAGRTTIIGINTLLKESEPTMLVIPDAVLLKEKDCYKLQQLMLEHCGLMRSRIAILDVHNGFKKRSLGTSDVIKNFRSGIGASFLDYGVAYYPWLNATVVGKEEVNFLNIDIATRATFTKLLKADNTQSAKEGLLSQTRADMINAEIERIPTAALETTLVLKGKADKVPKVDIKTLHQTLLTVSPLYREVMDTVHENLNLLPPSGGMAGVYSMVDSSVGVWQSPANVGIGSVVSPAVNITSEEQEDLNVPLSGKAINAIRTFPGRGVVVWGARTLDGNSQDWRYISVRRTVICIEQSLKYVVQAYVFEPNVASTWTNLKAPITSFLTNLWQQGALAGASADQAFSVDIGLGVTMTSVDILDGIMRVSVKLAITRPAEFIVINFQQQMKVS